MISLILTLALIGFLLWLVLTFIPMPPVFQKVILVLVVIVLVLWVLRLLGIGDIPVPTLR